MSTNRAEEPAEIHFYDESWDLRRDVEALRISKLQRESRRVSRPRPRLFAVSLFDSFSPEYLYSTPLYTVARAGAALARRRADGSTYDRTADLFGPLPEKLHLVPSPLPSSLDHMVWGGRFPGYRWLTEQMVARSLRLSRRRVVMYDHTAEPWTWPLNPEQAAEVGSLLAAGTSSSGRAPNTSMGERP